MPANATELVDGIISGLARIEADESAKRQFLGLVHSLCAAHGIRGVEQTDRIDFARRLHQAGTSRATTRDRLIACYGISRRQAYRIINDSLKLCQRPA